MENDHFKPAFPTFEGNHCKDYSDPGMSLRDYFAAKAMQGKLSNPEWLASDARTATEAYAMADAMLRAREAS